MSEFPHIVTFYSFKGGVGRSMAVLNVAYALAGRGRSVLLLDMDLEAPGLSGFLLRHKEIASPARQDIVDLIRWATDVSGAGPPIEQAAYPPLSDYVVSVPSEKLAELRPKYGELGRVDVIPVDENRVYYGRLTALGIATLDQPALVNVGNILRSWLKSRRIAIDVPDYYGPDVPRTATYDYILIDSRTGISEIGGLCIGPLADELVVLTGLNDQNIHGTRRFLEEVGILGKSAPGTDATDNKSRQSAVRIDPKPVLIVASPVPLGELERKRERFDQLEHAVGPVSLKLSYHPQMAILETVFVRDHKDEYLSAEYDTLVSDIMKMVDDSLNSALASVLASISDLSFSPELQRKIGLKLFSDVLGIGSADKIPFKPIARLAHTPDKTADTDFLIIDGIYRVYYGTPDRADHRTTINWATILSEWADQSTSPQLSELRRDAAVKALSIVIADGDAPAELRADALVGRGLIFAQRNQPEKAIADYTAVIEMPDGHVEQRGQALVNRGVHFCYQSEPEKAIADFTVVLEMPDVSAELTAKALGNRGWVHYVAGNPGAAIADLRQAIEVNPADRVCHSNLAIALLVDGQSEQAQAAYQRAIELARPDDLARMERDLQKAVESHGPLPGEEIVRTRLQARRLELEKKSGSVA